LIKDFSQVSLRPRPAIFLVILFFFTALKPQPEFWHRHAGLASLIAMPPRRTYYSKGEFHFVDVHVGARLRREQPWHQQNAAGESRRSNSRWANAHKS